ncbi:MAG: hypothetical protein ACPGU5_00820 [Lishizhenia sp.]
MKTIGLLLLFSVTCSFGQDLLYLPLQDKYTNHSQFQTEKITPSTFPLRYEQIKGEHSFHTSLSTQVLRKKWLGKKLFNEHFFEFKNNDFYLAINPLLNMNGGAILDDSLNKLYQNTRGLEIQGQIANKVSFYSSFHENQSVVAPYLATLYNSRGELYPQTDSTYIVQNAFIPRGARTKPFKANGYDYAFSTSYIHLNLSKFLNVTFGNAPSFIGYGKRSLLLSDYSSNRTSLKFDIKINKNFSYRIENGQLLNLYRRRFYTTVEAPFEKKAFSNRYLTFKSNNEKLSLSLFEGSIWFKEDDVISQRVNAQFYNPILMINPLISGLESSHVKHLIGLNFGYKINLHHLVYGQFVTDELKNLEYGLQVGLRSNYQLDKSRINFQIELNSTSSKLYQATNFRMSYTHNNYPLAYVFGNKTTELFTSVSYTIKNWYISAEHTSYQNSGLVNSHSNLFNSRADYVAQNLNWSHFTAGKLGYQFNSKNNLNVYGKLSRRASQNNQALMVEIGLVTDLINNFGNY